MKKKKDDMNHILGKHEDHPSWGTIHFNRWSSSHGQVLFNSPLRHHHGISLEIARASRRHSLNSDTVFAEEVLLRLNMSEVQFGQLISSFNRGGDGACTLEYVNGKHIPECPAERLKEKVSDDLSAHFEKTKTLVDKALDMATKLADQPSATKGARRELEQTLQFLQANLDTNLDFLKTCFVEEMEKVVTEAKAELQAHANHIIQQTGLKELKGKIPLLEGMKGEDR